MPNTKLPTPLLHIQQESPLKLFRRRIAINPCREHICTMPTSLKSRAGSIIGCRCQLSPDPLYWILSRHRVQKSRQTMWGENREIVNKKNQRRDDLILFSIFVAGHWVAGRKHFRVVKYFPHFENWPFVGSAWGWDGRQLCPMDRIKPTLWKMSPFGPGPTSHPATKPTHTSCELAKKDVKLESHMYSVYWVELFLSLSKLSKSKTTTKPLSLLWIHFVSLGASILFYSLRNHQIMESIVSAYQFYANRVTKYSSQH